MSEQEKEQAELNNFLNAKFILERSENPSPFFALVIVIVVICIIYCIFICFIKKSVSGIWYDDNDDEHEIKHNKFNDGIIIDKKFHGMYKGHVIIVYMNNIIKMGICVDNMIKWTDGSKWMADQ
jgi:hypothetical protein